MNFAIFRIQSLSRREGRNKKAIKKNFDPDGGGQDCSGSALWSEGGSKYFIDQPIKVSTLFFLQHPWEPRMRTAADTLPPHGIAPFLS